MTDNTGVPPQWAGLSKHLVARIFPCDSKGVEKADGVSVYGPITDASVDLTLNWQSPFENAGPESKLPSLMAMIQSGQLGIVASAVQADGFANEDGTRLKAFADKAKSWSTTLEGRTGITKLNSRQVFSGMPPVKVNFTLHFRAWSDPETEVEQPYRQLLSWALPQSLAPDGVLSEAIKGASNGDGLLRALFPSDAPQMVGFIFGGERWAPMVIEHIATPIDVARGADGRRLNMAVQVSVATLTALDKADLSNVFINGRSR